MFLHVFLLAAVAVVHVSSDLISEIRENNIESFKSKWTKSEFLNLLSTEREPTTLKNGFHIAIEENLVDVIEYLMEIFEEDNELFPSVMNAQDSDGKTALHAAVIAKNADLVGDFILAGADWNVSDNNGWYPVHYSVPKDGKNLEDMDTLMQLFQEDFEEEDPTGMNQYKVADALLKNPHLQQVNLTTRDTHETVMHMTAERDITDAILFLVSFEPDLNIQNINGDTALHLSSKVASEIHTPLELMEMGCDVNIKNKEGKVAKDYAASNKNLEDDDLNIYDEYLGGVPTRTDEEIEAFSSHPGNDGGYDPMDFELDGSVPDIDTLPEINPMGGKNRKRGESDPMHEDL